MNQLRSGAEPLQNVSRLLTWVAMLTLLIFSLAVSACHVTGRAGESSVAGGPAQQTLPSLRSTTGPGEATASISPTSFPSPSPMVTKTRTPRPALTETITPEAGIAISLTLPPAAEPVVNSHETSQAATIAQTVDNSTDRRCPEPAPAKPDYLHAYLSAQKWPEMKPELAPHLWLSKPLPGAGRLLITDWFPYGYDVGGRYLIHNGIDVAEPLGTPLLAAADGTVLVAGEDTESLYGWRCNWYGHLVVIELDDRWNDQPVYILYGHVLNINVEVSQRVERGQQVAEVGFGGAATLPHLHFEVRVGSNDFHSTRNPLLWLEPPASRGVIAGRLVDPEGRPWQGVLVSAVGLSEESEDYLTWTYLSDPEPVVNPDEGLAENFVFGDVKPGLYQLTVDLQGERYTVEIAVDGGQLYTVEIETLPLKTPTPAPADAQPSVTAGAGSE